MPVPAGPEREHEVVLIECPHVGGLVRRARQDQLALGAHRTLVATQSALAAFHHHAQARVDLLAPDQAAALELCVEILQHRRRDTHVALALALDEYLVAAGDDAHRQLLLDPGEIEMVLAEQDGAGGIVVEVHSAARAPKIGERCERAQA